MDRMDLSQYHRFEQYNAGEIEQFFSADIQASQTTSLHLGQTPDRINRANDFGGKYRIELYLQSALSPDWRERALAVDLLGIYEGTEKILLEALNDSVWQVREAAANRLGEKGLNAVAESALVPLLKDPVNAVRTSAAVALGEVSTGKNETLFALMDSLEDQVPPHAFEEEYHLQPFCNADLSRLGLGGESHGQFATDVELIGYKKYAVEAIERITDRTVGNVKEKPKEESESLSPADNDLYSELSSFPQNFSVEQLIQLLDHKVFSIQHISAYYLGRREDKSAVEPLLKFAQRGDLECHIAIEALGFTRSNLVLPFFRQVLETPSSLEKEHLKKEIGQALVHIGTKEAFELFTEFLPSQSVKNTEQTMHLWVHYLEKGIPEDPTARAFLRSKLPELKDALIEKEAMKNYQWEMISYSLEH